MPNLPLLLAYSNHFRSIINFTPTLELLYLEIKRLGLNKYPKFQEFIETDEFPPYLELKKQRGLLMKRNEDSGDVKITLSRDEVLLILSEPKGIHLYLAHRTQIMEVIKKEFDLKTLIDSVGLIIAQTRYELADLFSFILSIILKALKAQKLSFSGQNAFTLGKASQAERVDVLARHETPYISILSILQVVKLFGLVSSITVSSLIRTVCELHL